MALKITCCETYPCAFVLDLGFPVRGAYPGKEEIEQYDDILVWCKQEYGRTDFRKGSRWYTERMPDPDQIGRYKVRLGLQYEKDAILFKLRWL